MSLIPLYQKIEQHEWIDIPQGWLQGRTVYGGLVAAMLIHKARFTIADSSKKLLNCSVTFVGPVQQSPVKLTAEILRQGKSVTSIEVRLWQDDAVQSILLASFGALRDSEIHVNQEISAPDYSPVSELRIFSDNPLAPECMKQFELAWGEGKYPFSASEQPDFGGWFRFNSHIHENRCATEADLLALFDVWPPGVLPLFNMPAPASSLTWQITFLHSTNYQLQDWLKYKVVTDFAENGYATEYAHVWDAKNRLIAISRQTVTIFA